MKLTHFEFSLPAPVQHFAPEVPPFPRQLVWTAVFSEEGLRGLSITRRGADKGLAELDGRGRRRIQGAVGEGITLVEGLAGDRRLKELKQKLALRLSGKNSRFSWSEFDLRGHCQFHVRIWKAMHAIPFGQTLSYGEVAVAAGSPLAFRACGQACGANPILVFIPCHRVVSASGLGGFGCGIEWKKRLLALEGVFKT